MALVLLSTVSVGVQVLLDRVVARVGSVAITLTDVRAAISLGLVEVLEDVDPISEATAQLIERQLVLVEVERFPPPEPLPATVIAKAEVMRAQGGQDLNALVQATGFDDVRITQTARDSTRIDAYLEQRFGINLPVSEEDVARYYQAHPREFELDGRILSFAEVEPEARARASAERRQELIDDWIVDLRTRAEITILYP
jgi:hypothetical protein